MLPSLYYLAPVLGGYAITSYYLLKNPHILHKRKRLSFHCRHISHRGGAGERIENTLEAFDNAVSNHTDLLELDCQMTKDGQVVVSHDQNLLRQTGRDLNISDLTYDELPPYKKSLEVTFFPGHVSTGSDHRIPLLEEVFRRHPDIPINIEIKEDNEELIKKVSDLVKRYQRTDRTIWASMSDRIMRKCQAVRSPAVRSVAGVRGGELHAVYNKQNLLPAQPAPAQPLSGLFARQTNDAERSIPASGGERDPDLSLGFKSGKRLPESPRLRSLRDHDGLPLETAPLPTNIRGGAEGGRGSTGGGGRRWGREVQVLRCQKRASATGGGIL
ncbi:lysophospholipase D GDPD3 isoform X2 [Spea bombifrons]|uniref:lysophospholipase D GDPD3 isoform X2 n=1 Tax=Spea bombifrons TaxID=233779 RepID=UPI0023497616|nr:lysophospholipase D GDPD3 isoform X2 [Spea bombifrons]